MVGNLKDTTENEQKPRNGGPWEGLDELRLLRLRLRNMIVNFRYIIMLQNRMQLSMHGFYYGETRNESQNCKGDTGHTDDLMIKLVLY